MESVNGRLGEQDIIVRGADILTTGGYTKVPNFLLETNEISAGAKLTYAMLLKYAFTKGYCFPGQDRLAKDIGVTRQSTNGYIQELYKAKYIDIKRKGQGRPNTYLLNLLGNGKIRATR